MNKPQVRLLVGLAVLTIVNVALAFSQSPAIPLADSTPLTTTNRQAHEDTPFAGEHNPQIEALRRQLAHLGAELTAVKTGLQDLRSSHQSGNLGLDQDYGRNHFESREDAIQALREETETQAQGEAHEFANYQAAIETKFNLQYIDSAWASKMMDLIQAGLEVQDMDMTAVVDLQCKATLCRLEVEHASQMELDEFNFKLLEKVGHSLPHMSSNDSLADNSIITVVYLAQKGESLI